MTETKQNQGEVKLEDRVKNFENVLNFYQRQRALQEAFYSDPNSPEILEQIVDPYDGKTALAKTEAQNRLITRINLKKAEKTMKDAMAPEIYAEFKKKYFLPLPEDGKVGLYLALAAEYTPKEGISKELSEVIQLYTEATKLGKIATALKEAKGAEKENLVNALKGYWSKFKLEDRELGELLRISASMYGDTDNMTALANITLEQVNMQIGEAMKKYQSIKGESKFKELTNAVDREIEAKNDYAKVAEQFYAVYNAYQKAQEQKKENQTGKEDQKLADFAT